MNSVCVCVFSSHSFWTSSSLDVPAGVTQEEGHTGFFIHLLSAVRALIFLARRIQPFLFLVDPSRDTKFSGTHGDEGILIFPVQLTTSRIGNLTRLIHTLLPGICDDHTYICVVMSNLINTYIPL